MGAKQTAIGLLAATGYILLIWVLGGYTATFGIPDWWYPTFGRTGASAIAWLQIVHTLGVVTAAIPVAFGVVLFSRSHASYVACVAAGLAMAVMIYDVVGGYLLLADYPAANVEFRRVLSSIIDVVKVGLLFLLAVWSMLRVLPSDVASERP